MVRQIFTTKMFRGALVSAMKRGIVSVLEAAAAALAVNAPGGARSAGGGGGPAGGAVKRPAPRGGRGARANPVLIRSGKASPNPAAPGCGLGRLIGVFFGRLAGYKPPYRGSGQS